MHGSWLAAAASLARDCLGSRRTGAAFATQVGHPLATGVFAAEQVHLILPTALVEADESASECRDGGMDVLTVLIANGQVAERKGIPTLECYRNC